jgi:hypothetical protein
VVLFFCEHPFNSIISQYYARRKLHSRRRKGSNENEISDIYLPNVFNSFRVLSDYIGRRVRIFAIGSHLYTLGKSK